jgi:adhesin transport system outer membrane protein
MRRPNKYISEKSVREILFARIIFILFACCMATQLYAETKPITASPINHETRVLKLLAETAISRNPQLREAEANWHASQMDTEEVRGARWPRLDVSGTSKAKQFGPSYPYAYGNGVQGRVGVTLSYTLFDGGKVNTQISSRLHQEQAERDKYNQTREQTIFETASAYLQILKFRKLVDINQQNAARLAGLVNKMDEIVQAMGGRRSELTQAISRLLQAKENRVDAEAKLHEYEVQLLKLIGAENMSKTLNGKKPLIEPLSIEAALAAAKKSHPVLLAAYAEQLAMKDSASAVRKSNYWPVLEVQASKMSGTDMQGYTDSGQLYATIKWNAFQGFSGVSQEKAALARADAAQDKYDQSLVDIEYKLNSVWRDYQNQHDRIESLRILLVNTEQVRNDYYTQWETLGKRSLLELLTAENDYVSAMTSLVTSEFDEQLALARLRFESGTLSAWLLDDVK